MSNLDVIVEAALYREVSQLGDDKYIVMDEASEQLFVKKLLSVYNKDVFSFLQNNPSKYVPNIKLFWEEDNNLVVLEEYIEGRTLEDMLNDKNEDMRFDSKKKILLGICDGLIYLHAAEPPIIHRDIKAANIMIDSAGQVKIIDYDAAKIKSENRTKDTVLIGTVGNAAPEQYGFRQSDERTDIFALGKLLERMLPESGEAMLIVEKATKLQPELRYQNVKQVKNVVEKLRDPDGGTKINNWEKAVICMGVFLVVLFGVFLGVKLFRNTYPLTISSNDIKQIETTEEVENKNSDNKNIETTSEDTFSEDSFPEDISLMYFDEADKQIEEFKRTGTSEDAEKALEKCRVIKKRGLDSGEYLQKCYDVIDAYRIELSKNGNETDSKKLQEVLDEYKYILGIDE